MWACLGIAVCLSVAAGSAARAEELTVFGDDAYAPVIFQRHGGQPDGVLVRLLRRAESLSGDHYHLQLLPWKRAYEQARRGEGGLVGVSFTQERAAIFDFSKPLYDDDIRLVTLKGHEFPFTDLADLKGKSLGGVIGASYGEQVDKAYQNGDLGSIKDWCKKVRDMGVIVGVGIRIAATVI